MDTRFKPKPGDFGTHPIQISVPVGTISANTTTTVVIPKPYRKLFIRGAAYTTTTVPADSDGTITATVSKITAADGSATACTSALSLESATANRMNPFTVSGIGDAARLVAAGDVLKVVVTNDSAAIDTQHANAYVTIDALVLQ